MIGQTISHYRISGRLGAGGMGEVYRARDTRLDRDVALKILPAEIADDPERARRFEQEAKAVAALSHPNILSIHEFGFHRGRPFAAMELLEGASLGQRLGEGPLPARRALELGAQIAEGLAAAHERGVVHRDLKPDNVFVTTEGRAKILDFGIARVQRSDSQMTGFLTSAPVTEPGVVMGTVGYMAPEQVRGETADTRSDIFSLGIVLQEMLTGTRPFDGGSAAEVMGAILRDEPAPITTLDPSVSEDVARIVHRCLEKSPEQRFQSARDLAFSLANAGTASGPRRPIVEPRMRSRRGSRTLLGLALAGWVLAVVLLLFLGREPAPPVPSRLDTLTYSGRDWAPSASPGGDLIAFVSNRDGTPRIWLKQVTGGGEEPITAGHDDLPRFSPDGSQILFVRDEGGSRNLYRTSVVGGRPRKLLDDVLEADWSPDGLEVAFLRRSHGGGGNVITLGTATVQTGAEKALAQIEHRLTYGVRWSPRGDRIAVNEASMTGMVAVVSSIDLIDVATGRVERVNPTGWGGPYTAIAWAPGGESFVVAQPADVLAHVSGSPVQVMEVELESGRPHPLFWSPLRLPRFGWGYSTLAVLSPDEIVLDDQLTYAQLHEVRWAQDGSIASSRVLTRGLGHDRQPAVSPDGSRVIFSSNRSGNIDLWTVDRGTGELRQLTDDPADDWDPAFTPDGSHILWSSSRSGNMEIWMAAADGGQARQISHDGVDAENPTMSAGGWIVYASGNEDRIGIWKVRPDGSDATQLAAGAFLLPEVSPDGRHVLVSRFRVLNSVIRVIDIETDEMLPFEILLAPRVHHQAVQIGRARWTADGRGIAYIGQDEEGRSGVFVQDFVTGQDTAASRRKVAGFAVEFATESLGLTPDGRGIVISAQHNQRGLKLARDVGLRTWD